MGTHPRAAGLDPAGLDPAHIPAASALSVLPPTHETGRLIGQATPALRNMTSRRVLAGRPLEIPRRRPRRGLVQLDPPAQMNALARHLKSGPRMGPPQLTSKPKAPPAWRRVVGESSPWDGPPELQKQKTKK